MNKIGNGVLPNLFAKVVYFSDMDGSWNYILAWYRDGKWFDIDLYEDITNAVQYWNDVDLPSEL